MTLVAALIDAVGWYVVAYVAASVALRGLLG